MPNGAESIAGAPGPVLAGPSGSTRRQAEQVRDVGRWREAGEVYGAVLAASTEETCIRIQFGNMMEEAGEPPQAEAIFRAALACRALAFRECGGFDAAELPVWLNDIDFCLKLRAAGREVLFLGDIEATHQESRSLRNSFDEAMRDAAWRDALALMQARWGASFAEDPTCNPHCSRVGEAFEMLTEPSEAQVIGWIMVQG